MLSEFGDALQYRQAAVGGARLEHRVPEPEAQQLEQSCDAILGSGLQQPSQHGIACVERNADGDGFAMTDMVAGERLDLVRGPVAEVERASTAALEWVATPGDLTQVQLRAASDHVGHGGAVEQREGVDALLEAAEEGGVQHERKFNHINHTCD